MIGSFRAAFFHNGQPLPQTALIIIKEILEPLRCHCVSCASHPPQSVSGITILELFRLPAIGDQVQPMPAACELVLPK